MKVWNLRHRPPLLALFIMSLIFIAAITAQAGVVEIGKGKDVKLKFPAGMKITSGNVSQGIPIVCYLAEPIVEGSVVIVEEGAEATATVLEVEPAKKGGKPGKIKIGFTSLKPKGEYQLLTESEIKLSGTKEAKGKGKKLLSYLFIAGLFIKGSEAVIPTNVIYSVKVEESVYLESK